MAAVIDVCISVSLVASKCFVFGILCLAHILNWVDGVMLRGSLHTSNSAVVIVAVFGRNFTRLEVRQ